MCALIGHLVKTRRLQAVYLLHKTHRIIPVIIGKNENHVHRFLPGIDLLSAKEQNDPAETFPKYLLVFRHKEVFTIATVLLDEGYPGKSFSPHKHIET